jgi:putative hydrolase of the HAD superfamily
MKVIKYFDIIISNEDVEKNKPYPEPYNFAVDNLKINPEETLIIEDSINGFLAAAKSCVNLLWKVPEANYVNINNYKNIFEGADD